MIYGITYCDETMTKAAELCQKSMERNGVDLCAMATETYIYPYFKLLNQDIFRNKRGCGYWLWKPYLIWEQLNRIGDGEILIYSDAGVEFIGNVNHIISRMDQDVFLFGNNWNHADWCKFDVMKAINFSHIIGGANGLVSYGDLKQAQASVIFIRKSPESVRFVKEWLLWCQMPGFIDDSPSIAPNTPTFQEHRHDQAILTCLQIKHGYRLHWWPASYSDGAFVYDKLPQYAGDDYPVLFNHHRKRNNEY
jgi:hypothetical protein